MKPTQRYRLAAPAQIQSIRSQRRMNQNRENYEPARSSSNGRRAFHPATEINRQESIYQAISQQAQVWYAQNQARRATPSETETYNTLRQLARDYPAQAEEYNWEAANIMHQINNHKSGRDWDHIDLHGLFKREAVPFIADSLEKFSDTCSAAIRNHGYLTVIVGKGIHSPRGPVIAPAIRDLLMDNGYEYWGGSDVGFIIIKLQRD